MDGGSDGAWSIVSAHGDEERVRLPPFDEIEIPLARMWIDPHDAGG